MLKKFLKNISQKLNFSNSIQEFLKSSSIVFLANILGAALGYILMIIVSRELDNISSWTALNSFVMIVGIVIGALEIDISRRSAELLKNSLEESFFYFFAIKYDLKNPLFIFLFISPILVFLFKYIFGTDFLLLFIILLNIPFQILFQSQIGFLTGIFRSFDFAKVLIVLNVVRFIFTLVFLSLDFGIYSLVWGIFFSTFIGFGYSFFLIRKISQSENVSISISKNSLYSLSKEISSIVSTLFANLSLYLPLLILPLLGVYFLSPEDSDFFAILFSIGQILNLGIQSFLFLVIPFSAYNDDSKVFWTSFIFTLFSGILGVIFFVFFRKEIFSLFYRPEYSEYIVEMSLYFSTMGIFNLVFFIGKYFIGKGRQKALSPLLGILGIWIIFLYCFSNIGLDIMNFLWWLFGLIVLFIIHFLCLMKIYKTHILPKN